MRLTFSVAVDPNRNARLEEQKREIGRMLLEKGDVGGTQSIHRFLWNVIAVDRAFQRIRKASRDVVGHRRKQLLDVLEVAVRRGMADSAASRHFA